MTLTVVIGAVVTHSAQQGGQQRATESSAGAAVAHDVPDESRRASSPVLPPATREVQANEAQRVETNVVAQRPRGIVLPDGTELPVELAETRPDGVLDVPEGVGAAGWWDGSSRLGEPFGAIVVAGHVDSTTQGLGPFAQLLTIRAGQRVVLSAESLRQPFTVRSLKVIPRESLTQHPELTAATGPSRLVLVTCAGPFLPGAGGYQNLAVVTASPGAPPRRTGGRP